MRILASTLIAVLVAGFGVSAQQRSRPVPVPRPAPAAPVVMPSPAPTPTFASRLVLRAPRNVPAPLPNALHVNRNGGVFAVPFFWGWGVPAFYWEAPAVPLADGPPGGIQIDVQPWRAQVFVDGALMGYVGDFNGYYKHLEVPSGPHQVTIVEHGYQPMILDIVVTPGRTVTFRGTLSQALP